MNQRTANGSRRDGADAFCYSVSRYGVYLAGGDTIQPGFEPAGASRRFGGRVFSGRVFGGGVSRDGQSGNRANRIGPESVRPADALRVRKANRPGRREAVGSRNIGRESPRAPRFVARNSLRWERRTSVSRHRRGGSRPPRVPGTVRRRHGQRGQSNAGFEPERSASVARRVGCAGQPRVVEKHRPPPRGSSLD